MASQEDEEYQPLGQDEDPVDFAAIAPDLASAPTPEEALPPAPLASAAFENICVLVKKVGKLIMGLSGFKSPNVKFMVTVRLRLKNVYNFTLQPSAN